MISTNVNLLYIYLRCRPVNIHKLYFNQKYVYIFYSFVFQFFRLAAIEPAHSCAFPKPSTQPQLINSVSSFSSWQLFSAPLVMSLKVRKIHVKISPESVHSLTVYSPKIKIIICLQFALTDTTITTESLPTFHDQPHKLSTPLSVLGVTSLTYGEASQALRQFLFNCESPSEF